MPIIRLTPPLPEPGFRCHQWPHHHCWFLISAIPGKIWKLASYTERKERAKTEAGHSRLADGRFNPQNNLLTRPVLGKHKSLHPPTKIVKLDVVSLMAFSHIGSPDGPNDTFFSQDYLLGMTASVGRMGGRYIPRRGVDKEPLIANLAPRSARGHVF